MLLFYIQTKPMAEQPEMIHVRRSMLLCGWGIRSDGPDLIPELVALHAEGERNPALPPMALELAVISA
ncbi:hypothetical protein SLA2020_450480 [Shorea laevis]